MWWKKKKKVILSDSVEQTDFNNKLKDIGLSDEAIVMLNEEGIKSILDLKYKEDEQETNKLGKIFNKYYKERLT